MARGKIQAWGKKNISTYIVLLYNTIGQFLQTNIMEEPRMNDTLDRELQAAIQDRKLAGTLQKRLEAAEPLLYLNLTSTRLPGVILSTVTLQSRAKI